MVLWNGILIDGHNRYDICTRHGIPFSTVDKEFGSREDVLIWIITTQVSRRNLTPMQLSYYRGIHYKTDRKIQGTYERNKASAEKGHNVLFQPTAARLAEQYRVSNKTIMRDVKVSDAISAIGEASPEARRMIFSGEATITDPKPLDPMVSRMTEDYFAALREYLRDEDRAMLQQALRSCIDRLEVLYWQF